MKSLHALLLTLLTLCFLDPSAAFARGGDMGNAGDLVVREFSLTARTILMRMKLLPPSELDGIDLVKLKVAIENVDLQSRETTIYERTGQEVPALNFPKDNLLIVNRRMWAPLRSLERTEDRLTLVLHEFLFFIGVDDDNFARSNVIIPMLKVPDFSSTRYWNPLNPVNRISTNLVYNPGNCSLKGFDFDTQVQEETVTQTTEGDCGDAARRVSIRKTSLQAPPSSGWKGIFHRYEITVSDGAGHDLSQVTSEPEWGRCLLPEDGGCEVGGKLFAGGVEFRFWFKIK